MLIDNYLKNYEKLSVNGCENYRLSIVSFYKNNEAVVSILV